eukprot:15783-Rhodomonas_salina.2
MAQAAACGATAGIEHNRVENATKIGSTEGVLDGLVGALLCQAGRRRRSGGARSRCGRKHACRRSSTWPCIRSTARSFLVPLPSIFALFSPRSAPFRAGVLLPLSPLSSRSSLLAPQSRHRLLRVYIPSSSSWRRIMAGQPTSGTLRETRMGASTSGAGQGSSKATSCLAPPSLSGSTPS